MCVLSFPQENDKTIFYGGAYTGLYAIFLPRGEPYSGTRAKGKLDHPSCTLPHCVHRKLKMAAIAEAKLHEGA
jgi:hypothetical protein